MNSVGNILRSHASGLGAVMDEVVDKVVASDDRSKRLMLARFETLMKLPLIYSPFVSYYQRPNPSDTKLLQWCKIAFDMMVPPIYLDISTTPICTKFTFDSSFQAVITRKLEVRSDTEIGASVGWGGWGPPSVQLDITQKLGVTFGEESTQNNSLDIHQTWEQSQVPFGIRVLQEAYAQIMQKMFSSIVASATANPVILTDEEVKVLEKELEAHKNSGKEEENSSASS